MRRLRWRRPVGFLRQMMAGSTLLSSSAMPAQTGPGLLGQMPTVLRRNAEPRLRRAFGVEHHPAVGVEVEAQKALDLMVGTSLPLAAVAAPIRITDSRPPLARTIMTLTGHPPGLLATQVGCRWRPRTSRSTPVRRHALDTALLHQPFHLPLPPLPSGHRRTSSRGRRSRPMNGVPFELMKDVRAADLAEKDDDNSP